MSVSKAKTTIIVGSSEKLGAGKKKKQNFFNIMQSHIEKKKKRPKGNRTRNGRSACLDDEKTEENKRQNKNFDLFAAFESTKTSPNTWIN